MPGDLATRWAAAGDENCQGVDVERNGVEPLWRLPMLLALAADRGLLTVAGQHHDVVGERQHLGRQRAQHRRVVAAGEVRATDGPREEQVSGEHHLGDVGAVGVRHAEGDRSAGVARGVVDEELHPRQLEGGAVPELLDVVGLGPRGVLAAEQLGQHAAHVGGDAGQRVGQQVAVLGVDPRGGVIGSGDRRDAPHVVEVTMGHQHRDRLQPVLTDDLGDTGGGVLPGVDDHALLPGAGGHDVAVGAPGTCGEAGDQHPATLAMRTGRAEPRSSA